MRLSSSCSWALSLLNWLMFCWSSSPNCASMIPWDVTGHAAQKAVCDQSRQQGSEEA